MGYFNVGGWISYPLPPAEMLIKLADALAITVDYLLTGNPAEEMPLGNARLFRRFQAVEGFDSED